MSRPPRRIPQPHDLRRVGRAPARRLTTQVTKLARAQAEQDERNGLTVLQRGRVAVTEVVVELDGALTVLRAAEPGSDGLLHPAFDAAAPDRLRAAATGAGAALSELGDWRDSLF